MIIGWAPTRRTAGHERVEVGVRARRSRRARCGPSSGRCRRTSRRGSASSARRRRSSRSDVSVVPSCRSQMAWLTPSAVSGTVASPARAFTVTVTVRGIVGVCGGCGEGGRDGRRGEERRRRCATGAGTSAAWLPLGDGDGSAPIVGPPRDDCQYGQDRTGTCGTTVSIGPVPAAVASGIDRCDLTPAAARTMMAATSRPRGGNRPDVGGNGPALWAVTFVGKSAPFAGSEPARP